VHTHAAEILTISYSTHRQLLFTSAQAGTLTEACYELVLLVIDEDKKDRQVDRLRDRERQTLNRAQMSTNDQLTISFSTC
jgi:hypothetical protein